MLWRRASYDSREARSEAHAGPCHSGSGSGGTSDEEAAIRSYREAIELTDRQSLKDESAYLRLGKLFLAKSRCHDSLPLLQRAVELNPKSSEAAYLLGKNLHDLGNKVEAMSALNQSAVTDSRNPAPHYLLSRIYLKQGKAHEAQKEIEIFQTLSQTEKRAEEKSDILTDSVSSMSSQRSLASQPESSANQKAGPDPGATAVARYHLGLSLFRAARMPEAAEAL